MDLLCEPAVRMTTPMGGGAAETPGSHVVRAWYVQQSHFHRLRTSVTCRAEKTSKKTVARGVTERLAQGARLRLSSEILHLAPSLHAFLQSLS